MALKSKRLVEPLSKTGVFVEQVYCRKCMQNKIPINFYQATDRYLDSNGYMSVCKDCVNEMLDKMLITEGTLERALLKVCRVMNVKYDERVIQAFQKGLNTREEHGQEVRGIFGLYKSKLSSVGPRSGNGTEPTTDQDFTFYEPDNEAVKRIMEVEMEEKEYFEDTWGQGMTPDDYQFLENEFTKWKRTTKCDSQGEIILVKELCYKQNEIRKLRIEGKSVDASVKSLQEIMKNSALTPALQNAASSGKNAETFGNWVKEIEAMEPAEWYQDQTKYRDMDGINADILDIKRSIGNFITGSRDYNSTDIEQINDLDELEGNLESDGE